MSDLLKNFADLSQEKQQFLLLRLKQQREKTVNQQIIPQQNRELNSFPLSFAQQRLWFLHQLDSDIANYVIPLAVKVTGKLQIPALTASLREIMFRHWSLRTNFRSDMGQPFQVIQADGDWQLKIVDLQTLTDTDQQAETKRFAQQIAQDAFDLEHEPLVRTTLVVLAPTVHILLVCMHHIITDGWSIGIFTQELATLYPAYCGGQPNPLPELPLQYVDFACWQRQWLQGEVLEKQLDYWRQQLAAAPALLELPTTRPRPAIQTTNGASYEFSLSLDLSQKLAQLSQQAGVTLFMTLLAAFDILLYRYSGQTDILVGTPIANRNRTEIEGLIGFFVNTLVLRTDLSGQPNFTQLLNRVREVALGAYAHQDLPFELLVEAIQPQRSLSHTTLFQVMFILQNAPATDIELPELTLSPMAVDNPTVNFDLTLNVTETETGLVGNWLYNTDLFDQEMIARLNHHFQNLLNGIVSNPEQVIEELPLMTATDEEQLLAQAVGSTFDYSLDRSIPELFAIQCAQTPQAIALICDDEQLTYEQLDHQVNNLAQQLSNLGIKLQTVVGLCVQRSLDMVVGILAILKVGAIYLPLDPEYPIERLNLMMTDAGVGALVAYRHCLPSNLPDVPCLDLNESVTVLSNPLTLPPIKPSDPAYLLYTSGSTGRPKGVLVEHQALVAHCLGICDHYQLQPSDRILQFASLNFDPALEQLLPALITGCSVVLRGTNVWSPEELLTQIQNTGITVANLPTAYWRQVVLILHSQGMSLSAKLRLMIVGGEAMLPTDIQPWQSLNTESVKLLNAYGPTEATITALTFAVPRDFHGDRLPIGRPLTNRCAYIIDSIGKLCPIGIPGELHLGGASLARGYYQQPELTAEKFIPDYFSPDVKARMYRTGDLACYLPDGAIAYLGRLDQQVKIRGFRIELEEIAVTLCQHQDIQSAIVNLYTQVSGSPRLVAYYVTDQERSLTTEELRQFLAATLPDYMLPAAYVRLEQLPLAPNGKIDRRALPNPLPNIEPHLDLVLPSTPTEIALAQIWTEVIGVPQVGIHDNFFAIGGDSIMSLQIIARAHQVGIQLTPKQIFAHQSIAQLANVARTAQPIQAEQGIITGEVPLTPIQQWFFAQNLPNPHHFNQTILLNVPADLVTSRLQQVLTEIVSHHDALRLQFQLTEKGWQQSNATLGLLPQLQVVNLADVHPESQGAILTQICSQHQASLDLTAGCLLKATLFQMGADSPQRLLLVVHHLVVDGISWRILLDDIQKAYKQLSQGQAIAFFAKTTAWQYWAEQLTAYATNLTAELPYWQEQISHSVTPIPLDQLGDNTVASLETISVSLSATATQDLLHRVPTAYQTQINDLLLTALAQTMTAWTGDATTYCELEGHGREDLFPDVDISRTIGWFTTLFPVSLTLPTTSHPGSLLKTVKEQLRSIPQKGISYGLLRYCLQEPTLTAQPPAPISFNYLGQFDQAFDSQSYFQVASESAGSTQSLDGQRSHILEVNGLIAGGQLQMEWSYSSHLHHRQTIEQLAQNFITNLQALIDHCLEPTAGGYTPTDFPLVNLSQIELDDLLGDDWQQVTDLYPLSPMQRGMLFHSLYTPDADVYVEQLQCTLRGQLDTQAFRQAWEQVFARHEIFRTGFFWENLVEPLQCVRQQVSLPLTLHDWQSQDTQSQQQQLAALVISERRGFDLAKPPLIRLHLVQLAPDIYEFIWSHHHLLLDGWSLSLVLQEVFTCYHVYQHSQPIQLAPTTPYQTYIAWLQAQDLVAAKTFWQEQLQGIIAPTPLITASTAELTTGYQTVQIQLGIAPTANLQAFARQHQLTLSNLVQGAYALTLARYSGESEVVFGVTMAGRPPLLAGLESMVGLFINTLPLRVSVTDQYRLLPWLQTLQAQQVACEQYVYSPLVEIQAQSQIPQDLPLFESIVVFENYPVSTATVSSEGGVEIVAVTSSEQTNYPITLIAGAGTELTLKIIYDASRFTPEMIERWLGHLQMLLTNMAAQPDRQITKLPMLTAAERSQLLDWQSPVTPVTMGLQERFSQQVSLTPQAVAVVCGDRQLTYQALDAKANQLAHYLRSLGIDADVLVGVCLNRSLELAIAILAILKAGGAYVPLDPSYPSDRLGFMLTDTQIPVLLTSQGLAASLPEHTAHSICLDTDWSLVADYTTTSVVTVVQPEHLGYVIYTSGSTGLPKGVAMPQGALTNLIQWQLTHSCVPAGCTLQFAPISFDVSFQELFATWCGGGKLVLISESDRRDPAALLELIQTQQVERLFLPFVALQQIAETATSRGVIPSSLREIITAGEQLQITSAISNFFTKLPDCVLHNQYGPSESHVVSAFTLTGAVENWPVLPPIGRAITNTQLYILDQHRQPVALGVPGELYIGGNCLAHGYLHRTDLTATKFIPHPFDSSPDARLYQSGDLARYLPDGNIEYLGRIDDQVKIRGYRIEVGEIENHLSHHPQIQQVAVLARNDVPGDRRLVAYLVTQSQQTLTIDDLHSYLGKRLPEYMLPVACVCLTQLPLTPSGKIDRRSLPVPTYQRYRHTAYIAPHSQLEYQLAQIWSEVLGVPQIGRHDHFFQLGGHSLLATRLISRIRTVCQVDLSLRAVFTSPTIAELAVAIAQIATTEPVPPIVPVSIDQPLPLSFAQQRLWFLAQLQPGNIAANLSTAVRLTGNLQISALEHSLQTIYQRHTALRTNFVSINDQPHQIIRSDDNWQFSLVDLRGETAPAIEQLMITAAQQPFDLGQNPLMRCQLIQLSDSDFLLLVCMHHMITDGWSMGIFTQELATLYPAYCGGQPNPLPELPLQYVDFACWQRQWLQGEVLEKQLDYWRQQLAAAPALLELPTTRPRPAIQTTNGASYDFSLSPDLSQSLTQLSQQAGVTLFMTLLAAFDILLYRYSGQTDILVGTPIANRNRTEIEGLIGFFVNTLVLRTDLSGQPNFTQLLNRVREVALGAYAHQDLPFELLVEAIQPQRSLSHTTLFQVMFVLQNTPVTDIELPELTLSPVTVDISTVNFDLILNVTETETGLVGSWEYNTDLFDDAAIARMAGHFQTLLEGIVANPEQCISQLPLLTATEQQQLLVEWNQTQRDYSHEQCIHELFELQAELTPDQVAIVFENQQLTYQELNSRANQLAHHLRDLGVKPDVLVGLCVERSLEMIVGLLGILKAGGAYLPLDPDYPQERLSFMLSDSQVTVLLTQQRLLEKLPQYEAQVVCLDTGWQIISQLEQENYISEVSPTNLAYIIYTSGSTGQPKGVMIQHQSLVNFTQTAIIKYGLKSSDRILQFASISFDVAAEEIYPGLSCGATLILRNEEMLSSITTFVQKCRDWELTVLDLPTVYWHQITLELAQEIWQLPNSLRLVIIGGESALPTQLKLWQQYVNERPQLINAYGPTETTIEATLCNLSSLASTEYELEVSIGRPIDNVHVYILDQNLQPLPIGIPGELHIGGAGLAKGYLNRPELTQEKFIPHPFSNEYQARLYKTGDLVRFQSNGSIEFLGRIDNQVKIRGFRIELGEIEATISQHPIVQTVAVIAREDVSGDQRLVAYLVINQQVEPTINEWRQFLGQKLPDYMIPSAFVYLESLPLTPNGKVDKKNLPTPEFHRHLQDIFVTPRNPVEEILAKIWIDVLGVEQVGIYDNFFELGGHSLLATQLISRVRTTFKVELPLRSLFEAATVAELAQCIQQWLQDVPLSNVPKLEAFPRNRQLPLSFAQQRLWFLNQLQPDDIAYNMPLAVKLQGQCKLNILEQSLSEIIRRHEALRTNFITENGQPVQIIHPADSWQMAMIDLQHLPLTEQEIEIQRLATAEAQKPFALETDLLLRASVLVLSDTEHILLLTMHHIVSDGWSMGIFTQELATLYPAYCGGQPNPLPELPLQYVDFACWQRQWLQGEVLEKQLDYWRQQLAAAPALLELPTTRPRPAIQTTNGASYDFSLSLDLSQSLTQLSQQAGVTLFMTLLAAFDILLYRYSGQTDILVGTPIANRNRTEIEGLIGFFVNTLVLRTDLSGQPNFTQLLNRVREVALGAYAHQDLPFELLVEAIQPQRSLSHTTLFQVMFVLQNTPVTDIELPELTLSPVTVDISTVNFDLILNVTETETGLVGSWEYNTDLFDDAAIARMAGHFQTLLEGIVANPEQRIAELPLLPPWEHQKLLVEWNQTQREYPH
ncbi:non-ribosomal peptide synthetase, partial [Nostoc sp. MG11]|uniref:non-ribosomal peptide synthetase n=1 Tax=Nostoc sp. MG11 TaxID=2721166 RepID=UPI001868D73D